MKKQLLLLLSFMAVCLNVQAATVTKTVTLDAFDDMTWVSDGELVGTKDGVMVSFDYINYHEVINPGGLYFYGIGTQTGTSYERYPECTIRCSAGYHIKSVTFRFAGNNSVIHSTFQPFNDAGETELMGGNTTIRWTANSSSGVTGGYLNFVARNSVFGLRHVDIEFTYEDSSSGSASQIPDEIHIYRTYNQNSTGTYTETTGSIFSSADGNADYVCRSIGINGSASSDLILDPQSPNGNYVTYRLDTTTPKVGVAVCSCLATLATNVSVQKNITVYIHYTPVLTNPNLRFPKSVINEKYDGTVKTTAQVALSNSPAPISYSGGSGLTQTGSTSTFSATNVGEYTIVATQPQSGWYSSGTATYTFNIYQGNYYYWTNSEVVGTYDPNGTLTTVPGGGKLYSALSNTIETDIEFSSTESPLKRDVSPSSVGSYNMSPATSQNKGTNGNIFWQKPGTLTLTWQENHTVDKLSTTCTITLLPYPTTLGFTNDIVTLDLSEATTYTQVAAYTSTYYPGNGTTTYPGNDLHSWDKTTATITYSIVSGPATIDATTGVVTPTGSGAVVVKATSTGATWYADAEATYTLMVTNNVTLYEKDKDNTTTITNSDNQTTAHDVNTERLFIRGWNTICLPFDLSEDEFLVYFGSGATKHYFHDIYVGKNTGVFREFHEKMEAGVPYLIHLPEAVENPTFYGKQMQETEAKTVTISKGGETWQYVGIYSQTQLDTDLNHVRFLSATSQRLTTPSAAGKIKGMRAYFRVPYISATGGGSAKSVSLSWELFDEAASETTDITSLPVSIADTDGNLQSVYNLQGLCVNGTWSSLPKGIYVVGGKKVVKK